MKNFLKFWGTRGSCPVSGLQYSHFGGNTCCLEVQYEGTCVIIDGGTGIRPLGLTLKHQRKIDLFLSHMHWDHLIGLPFFAPLYQKETQITIWAPQGEGRSCRELFGQLLAKEFFPVHLDQIQAQLDFQVIHEKTPIRLGALTLDFHPTIHPGKTLCFKIQTPHQTIGYVTDNEIHLDKQQSFISFFKHCDYFIHEAQYTPGEYSQKTGWGHSSLSSARALIDKIQPAHWLVTHHDPEHTDNTLKELQQLASHQAPCPAEWIPDGHTLALK
jgi:phosphoribosyl 1,2-cyclic phosphodiesterase